MTDATHWTRRAFLTGSSAGLMLLSPWTPTSAAEAPIYVPHFFTSAEWSFVNAAIDRLIPADGTGPGALEAGVSEFIDRQLELPYGYGAFAYMQGPFPRGLPATLGYQLTYTPRELYRAGIEAANAECRKIHGHSFAELSQGQQEDYLAALEKGTAQTEGSLATAFFEQLLANTKEGYFADPIYGGNRNMAAWKMIGFPGARANFTDWITQQGKRYPYGPVSIAGRTAS